MLEYLLLSEGNWKRVYLNLMLWNPSLLLTQISWLEVLKWFLRIRFKILDTKHSRNSKIFFLNMIILYIIFIAMWWLLLTLSSFFMWCSDLTPFSKIIWELEVPFVWWKEDFITHIGFMSQLQTPRNQSSYVLTGVQEKWGWDSAFWN